MVRTTLVTVAAALAVAPATASAADTTPPHTTVTQYPGTGYPATPKFERRWPGIPFRVVYWPDDAVIAFEADQPARFECHAWDQPWYPCTSPVTRPTIDIGLGGEHLFVRAIDADGNVEDTPAHVIWSINPPLDPIVPPSITGTFKVGQQLSCDAGQWASPLFVPQVKQWHRDETTSSPVVAPGDTYTVVPADVGHQMYCDFTLFTSPAGWWFRGYTPRIPARPVKLPAAPECPATEPARASDANSDARLDDACRLSVTSDEASFYLDTDGDADTGDPSHDGADRYLRIADGAAILAYWSTADADFIEAAVLDSVEAEDGRTTWTGTGAELGLVPGETVTLYGEAGSIMSLPVTLAPVEEEPTPIPTPTASPTPIPAGGGSLNARIATVRGPAMVKRPALTGSTKAGHQLRCSAGTWKDVAKLTYSWARNAKTIKGQTKRTYTVRAADRGSRLNCAVTGANPGGKVTVTTRPVRVKQ